MARQIKQLDELMGGALTERFNQEMKRVLDNIYDPNTNPKAKRQIQIVIDLVPSERRDMAEFKVDVKSKLAPAAAIAQTVFLHMDDFGNVTATEMTKELPGQIDIDGNVQALPRVVEFGGGKAQSD